MKASIEYNVILPPINFNLIYIFQSVCAQLNLSAPEIFKSMYAKDLISYRLHLGSNLPLTA